jgi:hypothetical protein
MADDPLWDGRGVDKIHGGLGNDIVVLVQDGTPDTVHCGSGRDEVHILDCPCVAVDTIAADCETWGTDHDGAATGNR